MFLFVSMCIGCARLETPYLQAQLRFETIDPAVLLISLPDRVRVATMYQTLAGPAEAVVETIEQPIDLTAVAQAWSLPLAGTLRLFREVHITAARPAGDLISRLIHDPRRAGLPDCRLLEPYRPPQAVRDPLAPPPPTERDLDDPAATRCLVRTMIPADNLPTPRWYGFEPRRLRDGFHVPMMLLITMDHLTVIDTGGKPAVQYRLSAFLVDLKTPLLASVQSVDLDGTRIEGPSGVEAALAPSLDALRANDWAALRQSLLPVGRRYGYVLATQWGWVYPEYLAEQALQWKAENERKLEPR